MDPRSVKGTRKSRPSPPPSMSFGGKIQERISHTGVDRHSIIEGIQNRLEGRDRHLRGGNGVQDDAEPPTRTGILKKVMGEVCEDNWSGDPSLARAFVVLVPAVRSICVQCKAKLCQSGAELFPFPAVHQPLSVPSTQPRFRKVKSPVVRSCTEEVYFVVRSERMKGRTARS